MTRYVLVSPEFGVYLGGFTNLPFFAGNGAADDLNVPTFANPVDAWKHMARWPLAPEGMICRPVATGLRPLLVRDCRQQGVCQ